MSELEQRLRHAGLVTVHLASISSLVHLFFWVATAGRADVYETPLSGDVTGVLEGEAALTEKASVDAVEAAQGSFYHDRPAGVLYVRPNAASPYAAVFCAQLLHRAGNVQKTHEGAPYSGRMDSAPTLTIADSNQFGEFEMKCSGKLKIKNSDGRFDGLLNGVPQRVSFKLGVDLP